MNKKDLTERDICTKFINPNLEKAGKVTIDVIKGRNYNLDFKNPEEALLR